MIKAVDRILDVTRRDARSTVWDGVIPVCLKLIPAEVQRFNCRRSTVRTTTHKVEADTYRLIGWIIEKHLNFITRFAADDLHGVDVISIINRLRGIAGLDSTRYRLAILIPLHRPRAVDFSEELSTSAGTRKHRRVHWLG